MRQLYILYHYLIVNILYYFCSGIREGVIPLLGAIIGDIIGSPYEHSFIKTEEFPLFIEKSTFTDDTVLTVAIADGVMGDRDYSKSLRQYHRLYPDRGYGDSFYLWASSETSKPYGSFGNGSAMRVSPIGFAFNDLESVVLEATRSAEVTHNHTEGIKGAQATASAVFLARIGKTKREIADYIESSFDYDLTEPIASVRKWYSFDPTSHGTVPHSIRAFLESKDFVDAIRKAVSLGGDSDTLACIAGSIAHAYYRHIPDRVVEEAVHLLDDRLRSVTQEFCSRFCVLL